MIIRKNLLLINFKIENSTARQKKIIKFNYSKIGQRETCAKQT